jgi:hypothetical protein
MLSDYLGVGQVAPIIAGITFVFTFHMGCVILLIVIIATVMLSIPEIYTWKRQSGFFESLNNFENINTC